jgi:AcrR family transcriptional regulator
MPKQKRSREHVERMLDATAEVIAEAGIEGLTMTAVANRAGVSIATVYRYFADRDELAAEFLDGEMATMNQSVAEALFALEVVSIRSIVETAMFAHLRHHQAHPEAARAWFLAPRAKVVHEHVKRQDDELGLWLRNLTRGTNMVVEDAPPYGETLLTELGDRTFQWIFNQELSKEEQDDFVGRFVDMVASYLERFATPDGLHGISAAEFAAAVAAEAERADANGPKS